MGGIADGGFGAGLGAAAGAAASTIGVLLTRGHATIIYPESVLTFRIVAPVTFSTDRAPQAFRYVEPEDYRQTYAAQQPPPPALQPVYCGPYGCPPPPVYGPPYYGSYYGPQVYPYNWGRGVPCFTDEASTVRAAATTAVTGTRADRGVRGDGQRGYS